MIAAPVAVEITEKSQVSAARHGVQRLAQALEFDETRAAEAAIVATEAASNILKHADRGMLIARRLETGGGLGIEMLAVDSGQGMRDFEASAVDGVSTAGTQGTGLGAIRRQSDEVQVHTAHGQGTILRAVLWARPPTAKPRYEVGAVSVPKPGETACGDAFEVHEDDDSIALLVADGLGHGPEASRAAGSAVEVLLRHPGESPLRVLDLAHGRLRGTRGAAVAVARQARGSDELSYAGVGNIAAVAIEGGTRRAMVSHSGIVGHNVHKTIAYGYPWPVGALLVAHSDGLESQWDLAAEPGLAMAHPSLIAAALFRRHWRRRDDVTVVVIRRKE